MTGIFSWILERIAGLATSPEVAAVARKHAGDSMFFLSWYPDEYGEEIVRVIVGPLREALAGENEHVRAEVSKLIAMAEGWAEATDVFPSPCRGSSG